MLTAADIVIVGGGLSGLALAAQLAAPQFAHLKVLVLEQRSHYERDRTWSYWHTTPHAYSHLERMCWNRWRVSQNDTQDDLKNPADQVLGSTTKRAVLQSSTTAYCSIDADAFYSDAQDAIHKSQHVQLHLGTSVLRLQAANASNPQAAVFTKAGDEISAQWVFDARPPAPQKTSTLVQQFAGWEVHTPHDVFETNTVDLMAFEPSPHGLHFFYVLPYSPRTALVETTWVSSALHQPDYDAELHHFLRKQFGVTDFEVTYQEKGILTLQHNPASEGRNVIALGRGAGTLRPSTGYAFLDTLQHTQTIAESLARCPSAAALQDWKPPQFKRPARDTWMDRVFLKVLQSDWQNSANYFMQLFERVDAVTLVAFLSGQASWAQRFTVATALPTLPFAKAAAASLRKGA